MLSFLNQQLFFFIFFCVTDHSTLFYDPVLSPGLPVRAEAVSLLAFGLAAPSLPDWVPFRTSTVVQVGDDDYCIRKRARLMIKAVNNSNISNSRIWVNRCLKKCLKPMREHSIIFRRNALHD